MNELNLEPYFEDTVIEHKIFFNSNIISRTEQNYLFENISKVEYYKGKTKISDIAFLSK